MGSENWFYVSSDTQQGPVSLEVLRGMTQSGELHPDQLVWTEGMADWARAGSISSLFPPNTGTAPLNYLPAGGNPAAPVGVIGYYTPTDQFVYAGFWLRFCAIFVDGIVVAAPVWGLGFAIQYGLQQNGTFRQPNYEIYSLGLNLVMMVGNWLYFALMESSGWQATLGKRAVGIKVIDESGSRISFARATGRFFGKILSYVIFYIGFIMAGFTKRKQALHDIIASTLVIKKEQ